MPAREDHLATRVRDAVVRFCKQHLGRGPHEARVFICNDHVLIVVRDLLAPTERNLADADPSGWKGDGAILLRNALLYR